MRRKQKTGAEVAEHLRGCCLPILADSISDLSGLIGAAISREIERGSTNAEIVDYLRDHLPEDTASLEYDIFAGIIAWLGCPFVPDPEARRTSSDVPPATKEGGASCLIV